MYIAIDIGGTNTRIGITNSLETMGFEKNLAFANSHNFKTDYDTLVDTIRRNASSVRAIGIGIAGDISGDKRQVYDANNNPEWIQKPIVSRLGKHFGCPVFMDNDAVTTSLGVAFYDKQKDWQDFLYITWGTGIGGAQVKRIGNRYESQMLSWEENFAEWEQECGGKSIEKRFGKKVGELTKEQWDLVLSDFRMHSIDIVEDLNIDTIVLGGGVATKQEERILTIPKIIGIGLFITNLGEDAGLFGALGLIKSQNFSYRFIK